MILSDKEQIDALEAIEEASEAHRRREEEIRFQKALHDLISELAKIETEEECDLSGKHVSFIHTRRTLDSLITRARELEPYL